MKGQLLAVTAQSLLQLNSNISFNAVCSLGIGFQAHFISGFNIGPPIQRPSGTLLHWVYSSSVKPNNLNEITTPSVNATL